MHFYRPLAAINCTGGCRLKEKNIKKMFCFRMKRSTFQFLLELLRPNLCKQSNRFGRQPITPEKQLLIAIWMMATPNSYR